MATGTRARGCQFLGVSWLTARGAGASFELERSGPRSSTRHGLFGGKFKCGGRSEGIYSEALVPFVILFGTGACTLIVFQLHGLVRTDMRGTLVKKMGSSSIEVFGLGSLSEMLE